MTRIHLHSLTLTQLPTSGPLAPVNAHFIAEVQDGDKTIVRAESALRSESNGPWTFGINSLKVTSEPVVCSDLVNRIWTFKIRSDIPRSCSSVRVYFTETSKAFYFDPVPIRTKYMISKACVNQRYCLSTRVFTSYNCPFRLRLGFTVHELLVSPLDDRTILDMLAAALRERKTFGAYDIAILRESIDCRQQENRSKSRLLNLLGNDYLEQYRESHSDKALSKAVEVYHQASQTSPRNDNETLHYMSNYGCSLLDRYQRFGELNDLNTSIRQFQWTTKRTPNDHPDRPPMLYNLGTSLLTRFERLGDVDDLNDSVRTLHEAVQLTPDGRSEKPPWLSNLGAALLRRFERLGDVDDLNDSVIKLHEATELTADDHPNKASMLKNLGGSLMKRFERLGNVDDINQSVIKLKVAVQLIPDADPIKPSVLNNLGSSLLRRFERLGDVDDVNDSVVKLQLAVQLTPDGHSEKPSWLSNLGTSLLRRFARLGDVRDVNDSVIKLQEAIQLTPDDHPDMPSWLEGLGTSLVVRFGRLGDIDDINNSVTKFHEAIQLTPNGHPSIPSTLNNLGNSLLARFERLGDVQDINDSVLKRQEAVRLTPDGHPLKSSMLSNLGISLERRFRRRGAVEDISTSIIKLHEAVNLTPDGHPSKPSLLANLGNSLFRRFERLGDINDLNDSVLKKQEAVHLTPDDHPLMSFMLQNLGNSLLTRFERLGVVDDINDSIIKFRKAVQLTPNDLPTKFSLLSDLGISLAVRFLRLGDIDDINHSVVQFDEAIQLTPDDHPFKLALFTHLGNSLLTRFERLGDVNDINKMGILLQKAVLLTPEDHPEKPSRLNSLGAALFRKFERLGEIGDLNDSIVNLEEAAQLTPADHPLMPLVLNNLGASLTRRFERLGDIKDLNNSVIKFQRAAQLTPDGNPFKLHCFRNLGISLVSRFWKLEVHNDLGDASMAFSSAACAEYGAPSIRLRAAHLWAICLRALDATPAEILKPYSIAIPLLAEVAWLGSSLSDRHYQVMQDGNIVHEAAAVAFEARDHALAVEWLEQGRSVIWTQVLQLRTPLDDLDDREPVLSQRLRQNSIQLENVTSQKQVSALDDSTHTLASHVELSRENSDERAHRLASERKNLLGEIRKRPGFERFLLPKHIRELTRAASHGPIVILTFSELDETCCAFILRPNVTGDVVALKLESFPPSKAKRLHDQLKRLLRPHGRTASMPFYAQVKQFLRSHIRTDAKSEEVLHNSGSSVSGSSSSVAEDSPTAEAALKSFIFENRKNNSNAEFDRDGGALSHPQRNAKDRRVAAILAELWECVVKPILDALKITNPSPEKKPRLWWCPTGILSFLPLHAAGLYSSSAILGSKLSDFVVSSYIPTLSSLIDSATHSSSPSQPKLLAVARESDLPGTLVEIEYVKKAVKGHLPVTFLHGKNATLERVSSELESSNWVHFACHGVQNLVCPTESALLLAGTSRLTLAKLASLRSARGDLAFLSACQTAKGDEKLSDEAVHLSAAMLVTGYRGVIATMWSVGDRVAPKVARDVYNYLMLSGADTTQAAHALHVAVQNIAKGSQSNDDAALMSWVPFIHLGR